MRFTTIEALIDYYGCHDVPNQEGIKHVRLTYPITNQNYVAQNFHASSSSINMTPSGSASSFVSSSTFARSVSTLPLPLNRTSSQTSSASSVEKRHKSVTDIGQLSPTLPNLYQHQPHSPQTSPAQSSPKQRKSSVFNKIFNRHKSQTREGAKNTQCVYSVRNRSTSESSVENRPPMPLPEVPNENSLSSDTPKYDCVRNVEQDRAGELIQNLKRSDNYGESVDKCECGLSFEESELPRGWSMHISRETATYGRLFFMGPDQETAWNLPLDVSLELSADQQDRIRDLLSNPPRVESDSGAANLQPVGTSVARTSRVTLPDAPASSNSIAARQSSSSSSFQSQKSPLGSDDDASGTSFFHSVQTHPFPDPSRHPVQHNSSTGSTESPSVPVPISNHFDFAE